jgi:predicted Zn finger-like uncharacterized protein
MKATCPNCSTSYTVADEKIPETGAQIKCPKCNTMIVVQRTPLVELIPEPLVQPAHTPSTPLSSTPMSPQSKKALGYIIVALLWIGLSASLPILGVLALLIHTEVIISRLDVQGLKSASQRGYPSSRCR